MSAVLLSGYTTALTGVVNFTDPNHPGYGNPYLILNGEDGRFNWKDEITANSHVVSFCIPWENIPSFRAYVLMNVQTVGGVLTRVQPMTSPFVAQFPNTFALSMSGKGSGSDANVTSSRLYSDCIVDVTFGTLPYPTSGESNAFMEFNVSGSADYDTVPDSSMSFVTSGEKIDHDAGVLVAQKDMQITVHMIPNPDSWEANLTPLCGKVNSENVTIGSITYAPGYLLFPTYELNRTLDVSGNLTADGVIHLMWRQIPWNSGITSAGAVDAITPAPYVTGDLNGVFSA